MSPGIERYYSFSDQHVSTIVTQLLAERTMDGRWLLSYRPAIARHLNSMSKPALCISRLSDK